MTKKELKSLIEGAVKNWRINIEHVDREDIMRILNDIEQADDTVCYDLIADADANPIAIQTFTNIRFKENNYSVILNFNLDLY